MKLNKIIIIGMATITALTMAGCGGATTTSSSGDAAASGAGKTV